MTADVKELKSQMKIVIHLLAAIADPKGGESFLVDRFDRLLIVVLFH